MLPRPPPAASLGEARVLMLDHQLLRVSFNNMIPGGLEWHVPLVLLTPLILAVVAASLLSFLPRSRVLTVVLLLPAWVLQIVLLSMWAWSDALAGPAVLVLRPTWWGLLGPLVLALLAAWRFRLVSVDHLPRRLAPWRWAALQACALAMPILPIALPALLALWLVDGRPPRRLRGRWRTVGALGLVALLPWLAGPPASEFIAALILAGLLILLWPRRLERQLLLVAVISLMIQVITHLAIHGVG